MVSVATHQIAGTRYKRHIAPIGGDGGSVGGVIPLSTISGKGDNTGGVCLQIPHKNVPITVSVATHQVVSKRSKRHIAPIGGDGGIVGVSISLSTISGKGDATGGVCLQIPHKNVSTIVSIATHQVAGIRRKRHIAPIGKMEGR